MRIVIKFLVVFLILSARAFAVTNAFYDFEINLNGGPSALTGTAVGNGGTYFSGNPLGHLNNSCVGTFSDSNYITFPVGVFTGMSTSGMIKISCFNDSFSGSPAVFFAGNTTAHGNFFMFGQGSELKVRMPTNGGFVEFISSGAGIPSKQWVTFFVYYSGTSVKTDYLDPVSGIQTTIINGTAGSAVNFSDVTDVRIGRDSVLTGFSTPGYIDNLGFYTTTSPSEEQAVHPEYRITQLVGNSYAEGYNGVNGACTASFSDGERLAMINQFANRGLSAYFAGRFTRGTGCVSPLTEAAGGTKIADFDTGGSHDVRTSLAADIPHPSNRDIIVVDVIQRNDAAAGTSKAAFIASYESVLTNINAYSPLPMIVIQTSAQPPEAVQEAPYNDYTKTAYSWAVSQGVNMLGVIDWGLQTDTAWCDDNIHPLAAGYTTWGNFTANKLLNLLNVKNFEFGKTTLKTKI